MREKRSRTIRVKICGVFDCGTQTSADKPFCSEHLDAIERLEALKNEVEARMREVAAVEVSGWMVIPDGSPILADILSLFAVYGEMTMSALSDSTDLTLRVTEMYVKRLGTRGVVTKNGSRGSAVVTLNELRVAKKCLTKSNGKNGRVARFKDGAAISR